MNRKLTAPRKGANMCQMCKGPLVLALLGQIGRLLWFRCRNCGWEQHTTEQEG